jgi:hypothetical protein
LAIAEFEGLIERTTGAQRLENILSLCDALVDKSEVTEPEAGAVDPALREVAALGRKWAPKYKAKDHAVGAARLQFLLAQAQQVNAERTSGKRELSAAEASYHLAIEQLTACGDPDGLLLTAKAGLAAILQVTGTEQRDADKLRHAVRLQRELVESGPTANRSRADAGPLENLAEGMIALAAVTEAPERVALLDEAKASMGRAIQIHDRGGDAEQSRAARERVSEIEALIEA